MGTLKEGKAHDFERRGDLLVNKADGLETQLKLGSYAKAYQYYGNAVKYTWNRGHIKRLWSKMAEVMEMRGDLFAQIGRDCESQEKR